MRNYQALIHNKSATRIVKKFADDHSPVVIKSKHSQVSHGTERLVMTHSLAPKTGERMKVPHMIGDFNTDFSYGYSLVGQVMEGSDKWIGQYVHLLHPHQDYAFVSESEITPIPPELDLKSAALASNMETAVNALWDAGLQSGQQVAIVGYGLIGALVAHVCRFVTDAKVHVFDSNPNRLHLAEKHQFFTDHSTAFDCVFHTSATSEGLQNAIDLTKENGKIIELSWYGEKSVTINLGDSFHYGRKSIIASQVSQIPPHKQATWNFAKRKNYVFELLLKLQIGHLIDHEISFADSPTFFNNLRTNQTSSLTTLINY